MFRNIFGGLPKKPVHPASIIIQNAQDILNQAKDQFEKDNSNLGVILLDIVQHQLNVIISGEKSMAQQDQN